MIARRRGVAGIIWSPHHLITVSSHHRIIWSPHHLITASSHHCIIWSPHHLITASSITASSDRHRIIFIRHSAVMLRAGLMADRLRARFEPVLVECYRRMLQVPEFWNPREIRNPEIGNPEKDKKNYLQPYGALRKFSRSATVVFGWCQRRTPDSESRPIPTLRVVGVERSA